MLTNEQRTALVAAAQQAQGLAYAPYSNYNVGAALLSANGKTYLGANIENAAYPDGICAERTAAFQAILEGERQFQAVAVVTKDGGTPCGSCRQVLSEFGLNTIVLIADEAGQIKQETTVAELLPGAFGPSNLNR